MRQSSGRPADEVEAAVEAYGNMLYRLCLVMLKNRSDAEDAVQDTILRYMQKAPAFESREHEKAWLLRVASNRCRDLLRFRGRNEPMDPDELRACVEDPESCGIIEALTSLPEKFRLVLTLYYVEERPVAEIAKIIGRTESAVKMRLQKGRRLLEEVYRKEYM